MPPRQSPSNQNQQGKAPQAQPQTPMGGNQQVPQAAGNPRYRNPGLDPSPDPKIAVRAVNPPLTPDQVVGMAELPAAASIELPKIENIKIPKVKNKTIQGHLKAIEAKMTAVEKLMKNVVKLQKVQIHTEKELHERRRELYQNTFEEYLLDKTVDFGDRNDPDDPDCTCINLPKKPGGGGPGGPFGVPVALPGKRPRSQTGQQEQTEPRTTPSPLPIPAPVPGLPGTTPPKQPDLEEGENDIKPGPGRTRPREPALPGPSFNPLDLLRLLPYIFGPLLPGNPAYKAQSDASAGSDGFFRDLVDNNEFLSSLEETMQKDTSIADAAKARESQPLGGMFSPEMILQGLALKATMDQMEGSALSDLMLQSGFGVGMASRMAPALSNFKTNVSVRNPFRRRRMDIDDPAFDFDLATMEATGYTSPKLKSDLILDGVDMPTTVREVQPGTTVIQRGSINADEAMALHRKTDALTQGEEALGSLQQGLLDDLDSLGKSTPKTQASGGMGTKDLYGSDSREYFRNISKNITIPKFAGGGFMTTNEKAEYYMERMLNQALGVARRYDEAKAKAPNVETTTGSVVIPKSGGGFMGWFNKGVNTRIPVESKAKFGNPFSYFQKNPDPTTLFGDDALQRGQSNKNFKAGKKPGLFGRPDRAFGLDLIDSFKQRRLVTVPASQGGPMSGPTPITRELVKRPVRAMRSNIQHPVMLALDFIINDLLLNPRSTAVYDQVTGPNAYYNDPAYKGPMPSQNLENAQNSMMSSDTDQKFEIKPLPPEYIKIPGKQKAPNFVGDESPHIEMRTSIFTRSSSHTD